MGPNLTNDVSPRMVTLNTGVNIALLVTIIGAVFGATRWAEALRYDVKSVEHRVAGVEAAVREAGADRWRGKEMEQWVARFDEAVELWTTRLEAEMEQSFGAQVVLPRLKAPDPFASREVR